MVLTAREGADEQVVEVNELQDITPVCIYALQDAGQASLEEISHSRQSGGPQSTLLSKRHPEPVHVYHHGDPCHTQAVRVVQLGTAAMLVRAALHVVHPLRHSTPYKVQGLI